MTRALVEAAAAVALVVAVLASVAPAVHAADLTPEEARRVEQLVLLAKARRDEGRYIEALEALEEAARLHSADWILYNLARTYEDADSPEKARRIYERALAGEPEGALRDRVEEGLRRVRARLAMGRLRLEVLPDGASVTVDGERRGVTPLSPIELPAGRHHVRIEAPDRVPFEGEIEVAGAREIVRHIALLPLPPAAPLPAADPASPWEWVSLGAGAALLATGTALYVLGGDDIDRIRAADGYGTDDIVDMSARRAQALVDSGRAKQAAGVAMLIVGGAALATSATLFVLEGTVWAAPDAPSLTASPWVAPRGGGVGLSGTF